MFLFKLRFCFWLSFSFLCHLNFLVPLLSCLIKFHFLTKKNTHRHIIKKIRLVTWYTYVVYKNWVALFNLTNKIHIPSRLTWYIDRINHSEPFILKLWTFWLSNCWFILHQLENVNLDYVPCMLLCYKHTFPYCIYLYNIVCVIVVHDKFEFHIRKCALKYSIYYISDYFIENFKLFQQLGECVEAHIYI